MRTRQAAQFIAALVMVALAFAACGKKSTPTETFKAFYEAGKKRDAAGIRKTLSRGLLGRLEESAKSRNQPLDQLLVDVGLPDQMPEIRNERIDGDRATLEIKGRGDTWIPMSFVKEDGEWKLDSD